MPGNIVGLVRYLPWSNITLTCNAEHVQICPWRPCFGWLVPFAPPHLGLPGPHLFLLVEVLLPSLHFSLGQACSFSF